MAVRCHIAAISNAKEWLRSRDVEVHWWSDWIWFNNSHPKKARKDQDFIGQSFKSQPYHPPNWPGAWVEAGWPRGDEGVNMGWPVVTCESCDNAKVSSIAGCWEGGVKLSWRYRANVQTQPKDTLATAMFGWNWGRVAACLSRRWRSVLYMLKRQKKAFCRRSLLSGLVEMMVLGVSLCWIVFESFDFFNDLIPHRTCFSNSARISCSPPILIMRRTFSRRRTITPWRLNWPTAAVSWLFFFFACEAVLEGQRLEDMRDEAATEVFRACRACGGLELWETYTKRSDWHMPRATTSIGKNVCINLEAFASFDTMDVAVNWP